MFRWTFLVIRFYVFTIPSMFVRSNIYRPHLIFFCWDCRLDSEFRDRYDGMISRNNDRTISERFSLEPHWFLFWQLWFCNSTDTNLRHDQKTPAHQILYAIKLFIGLTLARTSIFRRETLPTMWQSNFENSMCFWQRSLFGSLLNLGIQNQPNPVQNISFPPFLGTQLRLVSLEIVPTTSYTILLWLFKFWCWHSSRLSFS